jgi:hypothetical protein
MSEKNLQHQQNDKKHRKLVRSPEKLSPCDLDPSFNPSFLSSSRNIFSAIQSNSRLSPTKSYNDQFPPQQVWLNSNLPSNVENSTISSASSSSSLPISSSTPSIALNRKPSITIKYSKDEGSKSDANHGHQSSLALHQQISKSIDNHPFTNTISTTEHADQTSNNFLINFENEQGCLHDLVKYSPKQQEQQKFEQPSKGLFCFDNNSTSSSLTPLVDQQHPTQQKQIFAHSPTSQSLNLNLIEQSKECKIVADGPIVLNKNNPFLNDTFDPITSHEDEGGGQIDTNFFNIDDSNESELLFFAEEALKKECDEMEEQLLKNKREKFSNASTMKASGLLLVVSPPTNKLFQVSIRFVDGSRGLKIRFRSFLGIIILLLICQIAMTAKLLAKVEITQRNKFRFWNFYYTSSVPHTFYLIFD